ncbi:MAG: hypothetical protein QGG25_11165, partial [Phycisphaerae bacterium]|nr:hypothetical protein [Phycisphaerae bacterium]
MRISSLRVTLGVAVLVQAAGVSLAAKADHNAAWGKSLTAARKVMSGQAALVQTVKDAGVTLGPWHAIGPFKDEAFGNIAKSFPYVFAPEKDVLAAAKGKVDLTKVYQAKKFPGMLTTKRT